MVPSLHWRIVLFLSCNIGGKWAIVQRKDARAGESLCICIHPWDFRRCWIKDY